jgi:hypothetical protein
MTERYKTLNEVMTYNMIRGIQSIWNLARKETDGLLFE